MNIIEQISIQFIYSINTQQTHYLGELRYPAEWPQCSATVSCGPPPAPPLNGTRVWLQGAEGDEDYDSSIEYSG